ncbi:MAG: polymer-forming cytoskeletal protein [Flavobacteriales bacterium]|nr:polymer-forming cytoskeletal protein [Flavobacteriales bacterium]MDG1765254.1 polymer-forming cytoskeletal protein [Flavobacteriales bacterium]
MRKNRGMARQTEATDNAINRIVEGTRFEGDIFCESNIRIDGTFKGNLESTGRLVIGVKGHIEGTVSCGDCEIEGSLNGKLVAREKVALKATAKVEGEVYYGQLSIETGAELSGTCYLGTKVKDIKSSNQSKSGQLDEKTA